MTDDHKYFQWMVENGQVRLSARAIILSSSGDRFQLEKNHGAREGCLNFIGRGVELGESLEGCLLREISEETNARMWSGIASWMANIDQFDI